MVFLAVHLLNYQSSSQQRSQCHTVHKNPGINVCAVVSAVVSLLTPNKDDDSLLHNRPITLLCKLIDRMVSSRLSWFLERSRLLEVIILELYYSILRRRMIPHGFMVCAKSYIVSISVATWVSLQIFCLTARFLCMSPTRCHVALIWWGRPSG